MPSREVKQWQKVIFAKGYTCVLRQGIETLSALELKAKADFDLRVAKFQDPAQQRVPHTVAREDLRLGSGSSNDANKGKDLTGKQILLAMREVKREICQVINPVWNKRCADKDGNTFPSGELNDDIRFETLEQLWLNENKDNLSKKDSEAAGPDVNKKFLWDAAWMGPSSWTAFLECGKAQQNQEYRVDHLCIEETSGPRKRDDKSQGDGKSLSRGAKKSKVNEEMTASGDNSTLCVVVSNQQAEARTMAKSVAIDKNKQLEELSAAEIRRHEKCHAFTAMFNDGTVWSSWLHTRGRMETESTDGGQDLIMMCKGGFPRVLHSGSGLSGTVWSPDGGHFLVQSAKNLFLGTTSELDIPLKPWLELRFGETLIGRPVWPCPNVVLYATSGGTPKRERVYAAQVTPATLAATDIEGGSVIFIAENGGSLLSYDHSPCSAQAVVVHRKANAMLAEVVLVSGVGGDPEQQPEVIAMDGRVEYCKPQVSFLSDGTLLARLNLVATALCEGPLPAGECQRKVDVNAPIPPPVKHGLYVLTIDGASTSFTTINVVGAGISNASYDVCSSSYGGECNMGAKEGFVLSPDRSTVAVTARSHRGDGDAHPSSSMSDQIWVVDLSTMESCHVAGGATGESTGCHVPVCFNPSNISLVYHYRSPVEWGDLWVKPDCRQETHSQLTHTMPVGLKAKLCKPTEICIESENGLHMHALLYAPLELAKGELKLSDLQPLVWAHGGPMTAISFDYNPLFNWLASLGYLVCVPNFRGSTGFGVDWMDADLRDGCGVADLADCFAAAEYLKVMNDPSSDINIRFRDDDVSTLDVRRGVGIAGHSWGGYLALQCMTSPFGPYWTGNAAEAPPLVFTCGFASAGIADWFVQQRETEVRYYDFNIMGGWVYQPEVAALARARSPLTHAAELRAPLLITHGESDIDVPFSQIGPFAEAAKLSAHPGADVTLVTYPGEGHGISGTVAQKDVLKRLQAFFHTNLKPWNFTDNPHGNLTAY